MKTLEQRLKTILASKNEYKRYINIKEGQSLEDTDFTVTKVGKDELIQDLLKAVEDYYRDSTGEVTFKIIGLDKLGEKVVAVENKFLSNLRDK